jgi:hypothetical protein
VKRNDETTAEADGWFTVSRAAALLGVPLPRIYDQIRDGKLQVRFEPGDPGKSDHPLVTSAELKQRRLPATLTASIGAASAAIPAPIPASKNGDAAASPTSAATGPAAQVAALTAQLEESRRTVARLEGELREARGALDEAETKLDASLKALYDRDVQIARVEAEARARELSRQDAETFIRHLEVRLDKTEERSEEKEKEIRRLAVGLGEARGEIKMLQPPKPEPVSAWKRHLASASIFVAAVGVAGGLGWTTYRFGAQSLQLEAAVATGVGVLLAFGAGLLLDRLRRAR